MPIQTWVCKNCNKECERVAVRGQKPRWCSQRCKDVGSSRKLCTDCQVAHVSSKVYARDGWRCHLCGVKVQRNAVAPHPQAPTIDHIIPLAAGGTHEPANVATAHFICNSRKGARSSGEQLALIG